MWEKVFKVFRDIKVSKVFKVVKVRMALKTLRLNPEIDEIPSYLLNKHYMRKHGKNAYYGQGK